jgi:hypothetical protein
MIDLITCILVLAFGRWNNSLPKKGQPLKAILLCWPSPGKGLSRNSGSFFKKSKQNCCNLKTVNFKNFLTPARSMRFNAICLPLCFFKLLGSVLGYYLVGKGNHLCTNPAS